MNKLALFGMALPPPPVVDLTIHVLVIPPPPPSPREQALADLDRLIAAGFARADVSVPDELAPLMHEMRETIAERYAIAEG